jgi:hypothetical protein
VNAGDDVITRGLYDPDGFAIGFAGGPWRTIRPKQDFGRNVGSANNDRDRYKENDGAQRSRPAKYFRQIV